MTQEATALAVRGLSDREIHQRIELNRRSNWGLEKGTPSQLNQVFLTCQGLKMLPGEHVTLYEGKVWLTVDGRVELARRNPEYRGHSQRPLGKDEKEAWGYDPGDIVIETTMRTVTNGEIKALGRVSAAELEGRRVEGVRLNPVARHRGAELAQARSLSRCSRFAFGMTPMLDDDEVDDIGRTVIEQRNDPERIKRDTATYDRIFNDDKDYLQTAVSHAVSEAPVESPATGALISSKTHPLWKGWLDLEAKARKAELGIDTSGVRLGEVTESQLQASIAQLEGLIADAAQQPQQAGLP